jgi:hypothetical protein
MDQQHNDKLTMFLAELAEVEHYNNAQNLVRIKIGKGDETKYFDLPLMATPEYPNPTVHYVLVVSPEGILDKLSNAILPNDPRLNQIPGYSSSERLSSSILGAYCWLVSRRIKNNTSNYNVGQIGNFNVDSNLTSEQENIRYSLSPGINKSYTTTIDQHKSDLKDDSIGVFVTDNSVLLKSGGGSIMLGPDGISTFGKQDSTATIASKGIMQDNPLSQILPETIITFPFAGKNIPNIDMILSIGNTLNRLVQTTTAMGHATTAVKNLAG